MTYDSKVLGTTIPANEALSGGVDIGNHSLVAIEMPESWSGTTITFQAKANRFDDEDWAPEDWDNVYDAAGNEISATVAAGRVIVDLPELGPLRYLRIRSGTSAVPVNQNPAREIKLIVK